MPKSLEKRFKDEGIAEAVLRREILENGLLPTSSKRGCSLEALKRYSEMVLQIKNPPYVTKPHIEGIERLECEFWTSLFDFVDSIKTENSKLREELHQHYLKEEVQKLEIKRRFIDLTNSIKEKQEILAKCRG